MTAARGVIAGIFIGGAGARFGGFAKGLLEAPDGGTIVARWRRVLDAAHVDRLVLVGRRVEYREIGLVAIDDEPSGIGPIGGLAALLRYAGDDCALALACDMPFVSSESIARLLTQHDAAVVAPWRDGLWEPLCARYDAARVLPVVRRRIAEGHLSLQPLLSECGAAAIALDGDELRDWDTPDDVLLAKSRRQARSRRSQCLGCPALEKEE